MTHVDIYLICLSFSELQASAVLPRNHVGPLPGLQLGNRPWVNILKLIEVATK